MFGTGCAFVVVGGGGVVVGCGVVWIGLGVGGCCGFLFFFGVVSLVGLFRGCLFLVRIFLCLVLLDGGVCGLVGFGCLGVWGFWVGSWVVWGGVGVGVGVWGGSECSECSFWWMVLWGCIRGLRCML